MMNSKIAKIFYQISEYLIMKDVAFKPQAYERAARLIESMEEDLDDVYKKGGVKALMKIEGIGESMAEKIEEFIKTGKIKDYEKLRKECPVDLEVLTSVEGIGPKMIKALYEKLHVKTLNDLEKAAKAHKIQKLPRFGPKVEENILTGIEFAKGSHGRFLLGFILPLVRKIENRLRDLDFVSQAVAAGSVRRMKETVGDIDILVVSSKPEKAMDYFCSMNEVEKIIAKGETKSSVRLDLGLDADIRVVAKESFGAALQYFTGNKDHNVVLRRLAQDKRFKLNEYGIFRGKKRIAGKTEEEVYKVLGLEWMDPELRENTGEIEASDSGKLPKLVDYKDIKGDLQMHSEWSDGAHSIKKLAETAGQLGHEYIAITDHTGELRIAGGMSEKEILRYFVEIEKIDKALKGIRILKGIETNIRKDGTIDISDKILAKADIVLASVHSNFKMGKEEMTKRICRAMENPYVDIISHPTARVIQGRPGYEVDFDKLFECAKRTGTVLEINSYPDRLDLSDVNIKRAIGAGVKLSIGTDSHSRNQLHNIELGIAQARRGWSEKKDIINTMGFEDLIVFLKRHKK
ncbi:MAG: DNA polymerase III [Candidatus Portnoybacteria bacterium RBG_19FT_COMBO_36_7]|uniref:DNA polymerase beta n=1 Tax=Candidatus Portnoybacteria bacterium RBG_19FT_COMBO_36_7 TaxID=1801992 RepID=A0A1G2F6S8_9BACT|nr:MAG: DNA polymerase III [Candidatus Portnoybacteria bacterium RBG_19FT_COMBO_36_7]